MTGRSSGRSTPAAWVAAGAWAGRSQVRHHVRAAGGGPGLLVGVAGHAVQGEPQGEHGGGGGDREQRAARPGPGGAACRGRPAGRRAGACPWVSPPARRARRGRPWCRRSAGSRRRTPRRASRSAGRRWPRPRVVGDDDQRLPGRVQAVEQPQHLQGGGAVEVAGRLVGQHHQRVVGQRPGDRDPLPLAAGQRRGQEPARSASPTRSSSSAARRRAARGERPASSAGSSTFSTAVSSSIRWNAWNTKPTASRRSRASARSDIRSTRCPASQTSPAVGRSRPPSRCSSVDFPQPLGPMTATVSPGATSRSTPSTARTRPAPCRIPCAARGRAAPGCIAGVVHDRLLPAGPVPLAGLQPAQVRLQPEHDALQQQPGSASGPARPSRRAGHPAAGAAARGAARR